ncbi:MAG: hypothetical protein IRY99_14940 [Isosphaeraceae bacterium]|nr:hypothetical protein [Isosphaeraceae bacterium]
MAKKKSSAPKSAETATRAKKTGAKKVSAKKAAPEKAAAPKGGAGAKKAAPKKAAAVKLNERQRDLLKRIQETGETGYEAAQKPEERSIQALIDRKLVKKGPKNKETGKLRYLVTKAGQKHLETSEPKPANP